MFRLNTGKASLLILIVSLAFTSFLLLRSLTTLIFANHDPFGGVVQTSVSICHWNEGQGGGYNPPQTVSIHSSGGQAGEPQGHDSHSNDIVPPYHWSGGSYSGNNWTTQTQAIWNNQCNTPSGSPSPSPSVSPSPSPNPSPSPSVSPSPSTSLSPSPSPTGSSSPSPTPTDGASPTPTPEVFGDGDVCDNIDGIQTSVPDGKHLDASGLNCVEFQLGGPPPPPLATGQVLGATTLGTTGAAEENLFLALFALGSILAGVGVRKFTSSKVR